MLIEEKVGLCSVLTLEIRKVLSELRDEIEFEEFVDELEDEDDEILDSLDSFESYED